MYFDSLLLIKQTKSIKNQYFNRSSAIITIVDASNAKYWKQFRKQGKNSVITYFPCIYQLLQAETCKIIRVTNRNTVHMLMESIQTV